MPTPWNLLFQASVGGTHTSNLISESLVGRAVASTRQKAGSVIGDVDPGGEKLPATANKALAQYTINVFETLNAEPPGIFATLSLMAAQGIGLAMALGFGLMLFAIRPGQFADTIKGLKSQEMHGFDCGNITSWRGDQFNTNTTAKRCLLVATYADRTNALSQFGTLTNKLPSNARLIMLGQSLLLSLPERDKTDRDKWLAELNHNSEQAFEVNSNNVLSLNIQFVPPTKDATDKLMEMTESYFEHCSNMQLITPWSPDATNEVEFETHLQMRDEWKRINEIVGDVWQEPEMKAFNRKLSASNKRDSIKDWKKHQEQRAELTLKLGDRLRARLRTNETENVSAALLDLHGRLAHVPETNTVDRAAIYREISKQLGGVKSPDGSDAEFVNPLGASSGSVSQDRLMVNMYWVMFNDPETGLPALIEWLCRQKCGAIKYSFQNGYDMGIFD